ncbi:hypothetical protein HELRODRAFT_193045 [Helobdella robusta]|uniref:BACK domain-containing protein n=1 Tax=Helobdella robusta TaxID=6412 RepID=T1FUK1_HELRO|nr:hypothetical protein HELRODRAFT_193045 [Helobdella robusta]ESN98314.1 hypothetical protein HELRODRAFT_193045 [Helobdella robusta]
MDNVHEIKKNGDDDDCTKIMLISNKGGCYEVDRKTFLQASSYFQALVNSGMRDAHSKKLTFECLSDACLEEVSRFLSKLKDNDNRLEDLAKDIRPLMHIESGLEVSFYLQITFMIDMYRNYVLKNLNKSTFIRILELADMYCWPEVTDNAFNFIFDNLQNIMKKSEMLKLTSDDMLRLVKSDLVNVPSEYELFKLVVEWILVDVPRRKWTEELLNKINFNLMTIIEKQEGYNILSELQLNVQPRGCDSNHSRTVGTLFAFGEPTTIKRKRKNQLFHTLSVYDFFKASNDKNKTTTAAKFKNGGVVAPLHYYKHYKSCVADNRLYIAGGYLTNSFRIYKKRTFVYDPVSREWSQVSDMHVGRVKFYFGAVDGILYAVAGFSSNPTRSVEKFVPCENRWYELAPLPTAAHNLAGTVCNSKIYVCGGRNNVSWSLDLLWQYDPIRNKWYKKSPMLTARFDHVMTSIGNKVFVVGGIICHADDVESIRYEEAMDMEAYDCLTDQWTSVLQLKRCIINFPSITINNSLYTFDDYSYRHCKKINYIDVQKLNLSKYLDDDDANKNLNGIVGDWSSTDKENISPRDDVDNVGEDGYNIEDDIETIDENLRDYFDSIDYMDSEGRFIDLHNTNPVGDDKDDHGTDENEDSNSEDGEEFDFNEINQESKDYQIYRYKTKNSHGFHCVGILNFPTNVQDNN